MSQLETYLQTSRFSTLDRTLSPAFASRSPPRGPCSGTVRWACLSVGRLRTGRSRSLAVSLILTPSLLSAAATRSRRSRRQESESASIISRRVEALHWNSSRAAPYRESPHFLTHDRLRLRRNVSRWYDCGSERTKPGPFLEHLGLPVGANIHPCRQHSISP